MPSNDPIRITSFAIEDQIDTRMGPITDTVTMWHVLVRDSSIRLLLVDTEDRVIPQRGIIRNRGRHRIASERQSRPKRLLTPRQDILLSKTLCCNDLHIIRSSASRHNKHCWIARRVMIAQEIIRRQTTRQQDLTLISIRPLP